VARVVTLPTSGTTGDPKRIFFSEADLARTVDFFHRGMTTLVDPGQRVLILLPGVLPDSVGALLRAALARMGVDGIVHGPVQDPARTLQVICDRRIDSLVGIPVQVLALARYPESDRLPRGAIRSVLLSTDYVPRAIVTALRERWGCEVFQHYGMTEMGYGGALECAAHNGYHLREADLLFEIVDPQTGQPVVDGRMGEVVFTTLTRQTMPLIRYRTGDLAAWIDGPCRCGSKLRRMGWVQGRLPDAIRLGDRLTLDLASLDEALFALPGAVDFRAVLDYNVRGASLGVALYSVTKGQSPPSRVKSALSQVPVIQAALADGLLTLGPIEVQAAHCGETKGAVATGAVGSVSAGSAIKRRIVIQ
jgi:phenylacetate-coenzyme A ligase PaaK-like adenylate-forming protein